MKNVPSTWRKCLAHGVGYHAPRAWLLPYTLALGTLVMCLERLKTRGTFVISCWYFG